MNIIRSTPINKSKIRKITVRAFWQRVTAVKYAELIGLSKEDNLLAAQISMINGAEFVDLDDQELVSAFHDLKEMGVFTDEDEQIIFADGIKSEVPINLK